MIRKKSGIYKINPAMHTKQRQIKCITRIKNGTYRERGDMNGNWNFNRSVDDDRQGKKRVNETIVGTGGRRGGAKRRRCSTSRDCKQWIGKDAPMRAPLSAPRCCSAPSLPCSWSILLRYLVVFFSLYPVLDPWSVFTSKSNSIFRLASVYWNWCSSRLLSYCTIWIWTMPFYLFIV